MVHAKLLRTKGRESIGVREVSMDLGGLIGVGLGEGQILEFKVGGRGPVDIENTASLIIVTPEPSDSWGMMFSLQYPNHAPAQESSYVPTF